MKLKNPNNTTSDINLTQKYHRNPDKTDSSHKNSGCKQAGLEKYTSSVLIYPPGRLVGYTSGDVRPTSGTRTEDLELRPTEPVE